MNDTSFIDNRSEKYGHMLTLDAFSKLVETLPDFPELLNQSDGGTAFFSLPHIDAVGEHIAELIHQQLECRQVLLASVDVALDRGHLMAASGLTTEQIQRRQKFMTENTLSSFVDSAALNMLQANEVVLASRSLMRLPAEFSADFGAQIMLFIPLMTNKLLIGCLAIGREGTENAYTQEEITLVKAIAKLIVMIIGRIQLLGQLADIYVYNQSIQQTNQRMNEFITMASHELKTPLTTVLGNIQIAQRRLQRWKGLVEPENETVLSKIEWIEHPLQDALTRARFQQNMINDMLDDSCIQSKSLILQTRICNLCEIVKEAIREGHKKLPTQPIVLQGDVEGNIPVIVDARRIGQVITNYLTNALKYSADDQAINVQLTVQGTTARVAIQDTGAGIAPEEQEQIWERFYRAKGIAVQHELDLSLGLGLYLCQNIIKLHHGNVGVDSNVGQGSTFWFTLPTVELDSTKDQMKGLEGTK